MAPKQPQQDIFLPMTNDYMQQIVRREKNHEFRRYRIASSVQRVWFYLNAPLSHIEYVCEIDPARTRDPGDDPLPEDGLGNTEFNEHHKDWDGYDFAYRVRSVYRLVEPIKLAELKAQYGIKCAPRGLVYTPKSIKNAVNWREQDCFWTDEVSEAYSSGQTSAKSGLKRTLKEESSAGLTGKKLKICELDDLDEVFPCLYTPQKVKIQGDGRIAAEWGNYLVNLLLVLGQESWYDVFGDRRERLLNGARSSDQGT